MARRITTEMINDWFSLGKSVQKLTISGGTTGGLGLPDPDAKPEPIKPSVSRVSEYDYVNEYLALEAEAHEKALKQDGETRVKAQPSSQLNEIEESTTVGMEMPSFDNLYDDLTQVYDNYNFSHQYNAKLLISKYKEDIVRAIETQQVVIVEGSTGSGKTTQVPQYILDHYVQLNKHCNIMVTQPRRLAAISIAKRVCSERGWSLGGIVGYQVGMDRCTSRDTRLTYMTTGVFLQHLVSHKDMNQYTHVILDEVHERDQEMDLSLLLVRKFLNTVSRHVKVILMSATFDVDLFGKYFSVPICKRMEMPITISLEGKSYVVSEHWVDALVSLGPLPDLDPLKPGISTEAYNLTLKLVKAFDTIEIREQDKEVNGFAPNRGSVLIFLPGLDEIQQMIRMFSAEATQLRWWILPLHSTITVEEQTRVFELPQPSYRKIILSTNIAESSVTVADIKFVIDFCLTKNLFCDPDTNYTTLRLEWASKANCRQRKGRAGRVSTGRIYRMITSNFFDYHLPEYIEPEMRRCPLDKIVLKLKQLDLSEPKALLALALEPPKLSDIERSILTLKEVGALDLLTHGKFYPYDGDLTFIGRILASLPLDIHLGKLIALGFVFGCLQESIIIAAGLSTQNCFSNPLKEPLNAYRNKISWAAGSFSDCIAILNAYKVWQSHKREKYFERPNNTSEKAWCRTNFLQLKRLKDMDVLVRELTLRLERLNMTPSNSKDTSSNTMEHLLLLKLVIAGAFYPHYFVREAPDEEMIARSLSGFDPNTTVMISGLPSKQGILYRHAIKDLFEYCGCEMKLHFEDTKVFVEFVHFRSQQNNKKDTLNLPSNQILPMVYLSVKMRMLRIPLTLKLYSSEELRLRLQELEAMTEEKAKNEGCLRTSRMTIAFGKSKLKQVDLPSAQQTIITLYITEVIDCGNFWAHDGEKETFRLLKELKMMTNENTLNPITGPLYPGQLCLAPYVDKVIEYHRARIEAIKGSQVEVFFVDYGTIECIDKQMLRAMDVDKYPMLNAIKMQAFECRLINIKPSSMRCPQGEWTEEANMKFKELISGHVLYARVYSIVQHVIHMELLLKLEDGQDLNLNDHLVKLGYAETTEEGFLSKQNNKIREQCRETCRDKSSAKLDQAVKLDSAYSSELHIPSEASFLTGMPQSNRTTKLKGPFSPLELQYYSMIQVGQMKQATIDQDSINCVSLDSEPQDKCSRIMVAAHTRLNPSSTTVISRNTTLMPNIHGLPAILCLLFTPAAEMRSDPTFTRYTGALCGLGCDETTGQPLYPEHDIELVLDTSFSTDDLSTVNAVRLFINYILKHSSDSVQIGHAQLFEMQERLRTRLIRLLSAQREIVDEIRYRYPYKWKRIPENRILKPTLENEECIHILHSGISLVSDFSEEMLAEQKMEHIKELHSKASQSLQFEEIRCELCSTMLNSPHELFIHISTGRHKLYEQEVFRQLATRS